MAISVHLLLYGDFMYVHLSNGSIVEYPVQNIQQITFSGVSNEDWAVILPKIPIRFLSNYPNPFNPMTTVRFELSEPYLAEVSIYNVKGQLVKVLAKDYMAAGLHELTWNGMNETGNYCASGVYFYRVQCNDQVKVNKMLILK